MGGGVMVGTWGDRPKYLKDSVDPKHMAIILFFRAEILHANPNCQKFSVSVGPHFLAHPISIAK